MEITKVIFRFFEGELIAIFPEIPSDDSLRTCLSFVHIGQHGACNPTHVIQNSRPAKPDEYAELKKELESEPYGYNLEVANRYSTKMMETRWEEMERTGMWNN